MTHREQCNLSPADFAELCRLWSDHVDALEQHPSVNTWALWAMGVILTAYPFARILAPAGLHDIVNVAPDVVRTVLHLI